MKTMKLLLLCALIAFLTTGCASKTAGDKEDEGCEITDTATNCGGDVPSYQDSAVTDGGAGVASDVAVAVLQNINFDFDQHVLSEQARMILDENARYLQENINANVLISGHCDERGSDEYNLALGERRAFAARDYLISMGISPQRIGTISYGEEKPLDISGTEAAWATNRRAEFAPQF